ncbi:MAG: alkaline phosphatase family protein [Anaerolineae bacterium]|nr:alkaline phosphatase family protein [Anaerolineae bacterium]
MSNVLIIFVDSFPYQLLSCVTHLNSATEKWPIIPGFGYSVNIHAEMFGGLLPDDVGYFGEWQYNPLASPGWRIRKILPLLDALCRPYVMNRGLQYLLTRNYQPGHIMPNIRLRDLDKFAMAGKHILESPKTYPHPTLFSEFSHLNVIPIPQLPKGTRDEQLYHTGLDAIAQHHQLLIPFPDLDGFGHTYGTDALPYQEHLSHLDTWIMHLIEQFQSHYPQHHIFIISDHGMVNVTQGIYLDIEEIVGKAGNHSYVYFSDANLLRVWVRDERIRTSLYEYLLQLEYGQLVSPDERQEYGLTSKHFGDFIFVLHEGLAFEPSTFAHHKPTGMHGYHPLDPGQQAIAIHYGPQWQHEPPQRMRDVYVMMRQALNEQW